MQPLNDHAADVQKDPPPERDPTFHTRVIETPAIGIVSEGPTSTHPCERTQFMVLNNDEEAGPLGILAQECSGCHGEGGNALPGFDFILDVAKLIDPEVVSMGTTKGRRLVIPGDPEGSYLVEKMMTGAMPPSIPGVTNSVTPEPNNVPATASETSVVHEWILNCLGAAPAKSSGSGGATGSSGSGGAAAESSGGAPGSGGASMAAGGRTGAAGAPAAGGAMGTGAGGRAATGAGGRMGGRGNAGAGGA